MHPPIRLAQFSLVPSLLVAMAFTLASCAATTDVRGPAPSEEQQVLAVDDEYVAAEAAHDEPSMRRLIEAG